MDGDCEPVNSKRGTLSNHSGFSPPSCAHSAKCLARTFLYAVLFLWVSPAAWAQQADESGTAVTIRALEHEWVEGQSRADSRVLDLIFDNSLVYVEYGSLVSKGEYLARIKRQNTQLDQITFEGTTVRVFGGTVLVLGTYVEKRTRTGKTEVQRWRFIDTWAYKNGSWVLIAAGAAPITK
jgi:hypothetical protein